MDAIDSVSEQPALPFGMLREQTSGHRSRGVDGAGAWPSARSCGKRREAAGSAGKSGLPDQVVRRESEPDGIGPGTRFKERDLSICSPATAWADDEREEFLELARQANVPGWWQALRDLLPSWFETYVAIGARGLGDPHLRGAVRARLLQTDEYARSVFRIAH
jgi:hypothetical protein